MILFETIHNIFLSFDIFPFFFLNRELWSSENCAEPCN